MASILLFFLPNLCPSFNINTAIIRKSDIADEPTSSADVLGGNVLLKIPVGGGRTHSGVPKRYPRCPGVSIGGGANTLLDLKGKKHSQRECFGQDPINFGHRT